MSDDPIWRRDPAAIASPCINICTIHPRAKICVGCFRTLEEIATWSQIDDAARQQVMDALPERESRLKARRGGRRRNRKTLDPKATQ